MKKYYKIITGYNAEEYIEIEEKELEKAYYCFLEKKDAVYSGGAVRGQRIQEIKPDYHKIMGWNRGYQLGALDFEELKNKGVDKACQKQLAETKEKVQYLVSTNQVHLVGKNIELPPKNPELSGASKTLADKFKI